MLRVLHVSVVLATILNQCVGGDGVKHIRPSYLAAEYTGPVNDTPTTLFLKLKGGDSPVGYAPVYINGKPIYRFTQPNFKNEIAPSIMLYDNQAVVNQIGFIHTSCSYPIQIGWMFDQIGDGFGPFKVVGACAGGECSGIISSTEPDVPAWVSP